MATSPVLRPAVLMALVAAAAPAPLRAECGVSGSATSEQDVHRARTACDSARSRFAGLFGTAPSALIVLHDEPGYEVALAGDVAVVFWPNGAALREQDPTRRRAAATHWQEILPHEVMHALTMAHFFAGARVDGGGYGTPLPDWFEEAVGIWGEPMQSRNARVEHARRLPEHMQDLAAILRTPHPAAADGAVMAAVPGAAPPADVALRAFYPQAIAVLSFVHDAGGAAAVRELARRFVRNPADTAALAGLPGMPEDMSAVLAAWTRWIARDAPDRAH